MSNTALGRTNIAILTNKSGGDLTQGAVVIVSSGTAASFTTTTTVGYNDGPLGVIIEPNGIANNATGMVALDGPIPKVNLSGSASLGDLFKSHSVAGQAVRHAAPMVTGDFGIVLGTGTTPAAILFGKPHIASSGAVSTDSIFDAKGDLAVGTGADAAAKLTVGANGTRPEAASGETTGIKWSAPPSYEYDYVEFTGNASITATTEDTANTVVTGNAIAYDGSTIVLIEFFSNSVVTPTGVAVYLWLYDGAASIGRIGLISPGAGIATQAIAYVARRLTPSNASHTYSIRSSLGSAGTGTISGGAGGHAAAMPGFIRITKAN